MILEWGVRTRRPPSMARMIAEVYDALKSAAPTR